MNFGLAFTYPFQDPDWAKKILLPALISIIPVIGQIYLLGWSLDITRRVIRHDPVVLPELNFERQFVDGLKGLVVGLVYAIPIIILSIPVSIVTSIAGNNGSMDSNTANVLVVAVSLCCNGLILVYSLLLAFLYPAAMGNMVSKEQLGAAFRFNEIFGLIRSAPGAYLFVLLGIIVSGIISQLGIIACGIGILATMAYAMAINGHLYGQAYNEATKNTTFAQVY
jgi:hypothetical protein